MIPQDVIERVRTETDIVGLIGEYVKLKRSGKSFVGLCPFHQEKTPSFNVSPDRQAYYCFGCGTGGNVITFIMNYENVTFPEAVKRLAERLGIKIQYTAEDDPTKPLVEALELAHKIYEDALWSSAGLDAQRYLVGRGLQKDTVKSFGLGLVPHDTSPILSAGRKAKLSTQVLNDAGVLASSSGRLYPFLAGRIVFPIYSAAGRLMGFSGRVWGDDPNPAKYVNTRETKLFKKSKLLYGLHKARPYLRREGVILVEGQTDVLRLVQEGFHNVVAPLGTAFTAEQAGVLSRYADKITLIFDGDDAGRKAAQRALGEVLAVDLDASLLLLPQGEDPDSYLASHSSDDFTSLLQAAVEPMPFLYNLLSPAGTSERRKAAEIMLSLINRIRDSLRRELYLDEASNLLRIDRKVLTDLVKPSRLKGTAAEPGGNRASAAGDLEERLLRMMIQKAEFIHLAAKHLPVSLFPEGEKRELLEKFYAFAAQKAEFSAGEILDLLTPQMRRKVSAWSLSDEVEYSKDDFTKALSNYLLNHKLQLLNRERQEAQEAGDQARVQRIHREKEKVIEQKAKITYEEI